jgi:hypothetical protein
MAVLLQLFGKMFSVCCLMFLMPCQWFDHVWSIVLGFLILADFFTVLLGSYFADGTLTSSDHLLPGS